MELNLENRLPDAEKLQYDQPEELDLKQKSNPLYEMIKKPFRKIKETYHRISDEFYHLTGW